MPKFIQMLSFGIRSISLSKQRCFKRHIQPRTIPTVSERWLSIGERLHNSVRKVLNNGEYRKQ